MRIEIEATSLYYYDEILKIRLLKKLNDEIIYVCSIIFYHTVRFETFL